MELTKNNRGGGVASLSLRETKLDMSNAAEFKKRVALMIQDETKIVLDMSMVEFVDSSGLGSILSCLRDLRARGGELLLCCVQPRVMAMFELVRMQKVVPVVASYEDALQIFQGQKAA